jgi:hypothetical protein
MWFPCVQKAEIKLQGIYGLENAILDSGLPVMLGIVHIKNPDT